MTTEVATEHQDPQSSAPQGLAAASSTVAAGDQRCCVEAECGYVRAGVHRSDTGFRADGVRPVVEPGHGGGDRAEDAGADEQVTDPPRCAAVTVWNR